MRRAVMRARWGQALLAALALLGPDGPRSQAPTGGGAERDAAPPWTELTDYTESLSRAAFAACDRDGDDRLSLFEAARTIEGLADIRDRQLLNRLDSNTDGYLQWPEFDQRFRALVEAGRPLRLRPLYALPRERAAALDKASDVATPSWLDPNRDGAVQIAELDAVLRQARLPAEVVARAQALDANGDGVLGQAELTAIAPLLGLAWQALGAPPAAVGAPSARGSTPAARGSTPSGSADLPEGYRHADRDGNGGLDRRELAEALRRLDPRLLRWSERILRDADTSGNHSLQAEEIRPRRRDAATR